ncbi:unnamed protein product [Rhizophagus irregularis]|nr:unnamed protein product [Rhizophagus irregularis]
MEKNQDSFGGLPKNENPKIRSFGWASKDRKNPKIHKFGGLPKNENPKIRSSGSLWFLEKVEPRFVLRILVRVVFRKSEEPRFVSIPNLGSGDFRRMDEPRFVRFGWASDKRRNQDSYPVTSVSVGLLIRFLNVGRGVAVD